MITNNLEPKHVWEIFEKVMAKNPRPSKKEDKIRQSIKDWIEKKKAEQSKSSIKIELFEDKTGNILIKKSATAGMEHIQPILLQGHMDMVCETNLPEGYDFDTKGITPRIQENKEWIEATGTTLGADDGLGVALVLGLLFDPDLKLRHGPIEILLTVDEETGLTGASNLDLIKLPIQSKIMINIDSEELGTITIGSAGGGDMLLKKKLSKPSSDSMKYDLLFEVKVLGLFGGHSGVDIHLPRANANKIVGRILSSILNLTEVVLVEWNGGSKHNAITRESNVIFAVPKNLEKIVDNDVKLQIKDIVNYYHTKNERGESFEPNITIEFKKVRTKVPTEQNILTPKESREFITIINTIPQGYIHFSPVVKDLVESSNNVAIIKTTYDEIILHLSTRSNIDSELEYYRNMLSQLGIMGGFEVIKQKSYSGWKPDPNAPFLSYVKKHYEEVLQEFVKIEAVHAGLETGIIGAKIPGIQMVSIGPTVENPHTPNEKAKIKDVKILYDLLKLILADLGNFS